VLEIGAVVVGSFSGGIHAVNRQADIIGIFVLSFLTALGGGIVRDVLIGAGTPLALERPAYLIIVGISSLVTLFLASWFARVNRLLLVLDALLMGLWTVIGTERAFAYRLPVTSAIFLGTVTATGGGMLRDVMSGETPQVLKKGELHVTAAFIAATVDSLLIRGMYLPPLVGELTIVALAAGIRLSALRWHVTAPTPADVGDLWRRWRRTGGAQPASTSPASRKLRRSASRTSGSPGATLSSLPRRNQSSSSSTSW
jgi:uncharacterized membrane protein YeiH